MVGLYCKFIWALTFFVIISARRRSSFQPRPHRFWRQPEHGRIQAGRRRGGWGWGVRVANVFTCVNGGGVVECGVCEGVYEGMRGVGKGGEMV